MSRPQCVRIQPGVLGKGTRGSLEVNYSRLGHGVRVQETTYGGSMEEFKFRQVLGV